MKKRGRGRPPVNYTTRRINFSVPEVFADEFRLRCKFVYQELKLEHFKSEKNEGK